MSHAPRVARALAGLVLGVLTLGDAGGPLVAAGRGFPCSGTDTEQEPNDTPGTGTVLQLDANLSRGIYGTIGAPGDVDYYRIQATAGHRLWASVDTGRSSDVPPFSRDSLLQVYAPDGTTLLESDDDDGTGNGRDYSIESQEASIVAGLTLPATGVYVVRVSAKSPSAQIAPYTLLLGATSFTTSEQEPNDTPGTALHPLSWAIDGTLGGPGDVDYLALDLLDAGYPLVMVDGDPERDGIGTDTVLEWVDYFSPLPVPPALMHLDSSGPAGAPSPAAEGALVTNGVHRVRITGPAAGTYRVGVVWSGYCSVPVLLEKLDVE